MLMDPRHGEPVAMQWVMRADMITVNSCVRKDSSALLTHKRPEDSTSSNSSGSGTQAGPSFKSAEGTAIVPRVANLGSCMRKELQATPDYAKGNLC